MRRSKLPTQRQHILLHILGIPTSFWDNIISSNS